MHPTFLRSRNVTLHRTPPAWPAAIPTARHAHAIARECFPAAYAAQPVALLGLPSEAGVALNSGKPGAALGPAAFRAALASYGVANTMLGALPAVWDAGDVQPPPASLSLEAQLHEMHARVKHAATDITSQVASTRALPIAIGGGHDLTCAFVQGVVAHARSHDANAPLAVLNFDAHLDVRDTLGSGMPFRVINQTLHPIAMATIGINPLVNTREHADYYSQHAHGTFLSSEQSLGRWLSNLPSSCMLACSFDMDVLDASCAPGVSARNPQGLQVSEAAQLLRIAASDRRLICLDFMELCPPRDEPAYNIATDEPGRTARAAAHLFLTVLRARAAHNENLPQAFA